MDFFFFFFLQISGVREEHSLKVFHDVIEASEQHIA